jgi:hypothetical protein
MRTAIAAAAFLAAAALLPQAAAAQPMAMSAKLSAASEVPPNASTGTGTGTFSLDMGSKVLTYRVEYSGLTGPATAAHIHGPAAPGANAPPVVPFANPASPITGTVTLTDAQIADLHAGRYYVNVHTAANRGGEIRGQIVMGQ